MASSSICCARLNLLRFGHDARDDPALAPRQRARLGDGDRVARLRLVALVVRDELRRLLLALAVDAVAHLALHRDDDGLVHLVADDFAGDLLLDAHACACSFSRRIVFTLARSRRTSRTRAGASSCPIDFWMRSRNSWSSSSFSRSRSTSTDSSRISSTFMRSSPDRTVWRT